MTTEIDWKTRIVAAARAARRDLDDDVAEELAQHGASAHASARGRGDTDVEAHAYVAKLIDVWVAQGGSLERPTRRSPPPPPPSAGRLIDGLRRDIRYGVRVLARQRGFAAIAVLTIAVAIGATTTLFSVVDAVLLRPLPWPAADRLVRLTESRAGASRQTPLSVTNLAYLAIRDAPQTMEALGAWSVGAATLTTDTGAERLRAARVTPEVFAILRAAPVYGQLFTTDDAPEIVVAHGLWLDHFGGAPDAIGRTISIDGGPQRIVGVMPSGFVFPDRETQVWRPLRIPTAPAMTLVSVMGRLRPGVSPAQVAAEATTRAAGASSSPTALMMLFGTTGAAQIAAEPALDALTHDVRPGLIALFAAVSMLLVTAVANIAGLQLARATTRYREIAIRAALGAGTGRLAQQLVVENLILAAAGGLTGLALALGLHRALPSVLPSDFPRLSDMAIRPTVIGFALGASILTGIVLGLLPAIHLRRLRLSQALTDDSGGAIGGSRHRLRVGIMTAQIAIACMLLVGALLLSRSFVAMLTLDRGFAPAHVLSARLNLSPAAAPASRIESLEDVVARARALPGAPIVAATTGLPLSGSENLSGFDMPSLRPPTGVNINAHAVRSVVTVDYVKALGLRLAAGRDFSPADDSAAAPKVVLVNRTFADQYLTAHAVGDRIRNFMTGDGVDFEVIGIVDDMRRRGVTDRVQPEVYSLLRQSPRPSATPDLVIRTSGDPAPLAEPLRQLVRKAVPTATLDSVRSMDDRILSSLARPRLYAVLLVAFAASALVIACVGLVGVLSYTVAQRSREIALRLALGAGTGHVLRLVFSQGVRVTAIGIGAGLLSAFVSMRYLAALLYGVSMHDQLSFVAAPVVLAVVALGACVAPALRAIRIDPLRQLRS